MLRSCLLKRYSILIYLIHHHILKEDIKPFANTKSFCLDFDEEDVMRHGCSCLPMKILNLP